MEDQLGAAGEGLGGDRVHVADDDVGPQADVEEGVRSAVDADEHRPEVGDVAAAQRCEVGLVAIAPDDDEDVPPVEVGVNLGQADRLDEVLALVTQVLDGVLGETLERGSDLALRGIQALLDGLHADEFALGHDVAANEDPAVVDLEHVPVADDVEKVRDHRVDQRDTGRRQHQGAEVRVGPGGGPGHVHHCPHLPFHQALCRDAVEVLVVDQGDFARLQPSHEADHRNVRGQRDIRGRG